MSEATPESGKRWSRRLLRTSLFTLGALFLLVAILLVLASTAPGERVIRDRVLAAVNDALPGRVEVGAIDLQMNRIVLEDLALFTPEGERVATIERVTADVSVAALLRKQVRIHVAEVVRPEVFLVQDARGLNVLRAVRDPHRERKPEEDTRGSILVVLPKARIIDGVAQYVLVDDESDEETLERTWRLEDIDLAGSFRFDARHEAMEIDARATAEATQPTKAPLTLSFKGSMKEDRLAGDVDLELGDLLVRGQVIRSGEKRLSVNLERAEVPPELAEALLPEWPLETLLILTGEASLEGALIKADLDVAAGSGSMAIVGDFDLGSFTSSGLNLRAEDVDLSELIPDGPKTKLTFEADAKGGGRYLELMTGELKLDAAPFLLDQQRVGPLKLEASVDDGKLTLKALELVLPGASLTASGGGTMEALKIDGTLRADDLRKAAKVIGELTPGSPPPVAGKGKLQFSLRGPARSPDVAFNGAFAQLKYDDLEAQDLRVSGRVPDVTRPFDLETKLQVAGIDLGGRAFKDVSLDVGSEGRKVTLTASVAGYAEIRLYLEGLRDLDGNGLRIDRLTLTYPEASWTLTERSHLRFKEGDLALASLALRSGEQQLVLKGSLSGKRVSADVEGEQVALGQLPRAFVPEHLGLDGRVSFEAEVRGRLPLPTGALALRLEGGRFREAVGVFAKLEAKYARDRVAGALAVQSPQGAFSSTFELPVMGLLRASNAPLSANVLLERLDVGETLKLAQQLGKAEPVADVLPDGNLTGQLSLSGTAADPRGRLELVGRNLQHPVWLPQDTGLDLTVFTEERGTLSATATLVGVGDSGTLRLDTPLTAARLRRDPPTPEELLALPVRLSGRLVGIPLALLEPFGAPFTTGALALELEVEGSARAPEGRVRAAFDEVTLDGSALFSGSLVVKAGAQEVQTELEARLLHEGAAPTRLVTLNGRAGAPVSELLKREAVAKVPLELEAALGPARLRELPFLTRTEEELAEEVDAPLDGVVTGTMTLQGTLSDPKITLRTSAESLGVGKLALGKLKLEGRYADAATVAELQVTAPQGGRLVASGKLTQNLSLPALQRGIALQNSPISATVEARRFDLAFLSGIAPLIRRLGGELDADAQLGGTVGAPTYRGDLKLADGVLSLFGYGEYRDIQLALEVDEERINLPLLSAKSGAGELRFAAKATRQGEQYLMAGEAQLQRFPIIVDDQPYANVTLRATLRGELSQRLVNIRELAIAEADIVLPETGRKDLQELDRPDDIVLVRKGVPTDPRVRKRRRDEALAKKKAQGGLEVSEAPAPQAPQETPARQYWVTVNAPRNLWVRGADVLAEVGLSEGFKIEYAARPLIFGEVRIRQGRVDVFGRQFEVQRDSQIRFTGPPKTPYLNLTATYSNASGAEPVVVFVTVRGQGKDFTFRVQSQPALSESEIYTLLATGRRTLKRGSGASLTGADAASVVGSVVASELKRTFASKLPIDVDVLSIEAGEEGFQDARVEAGTYLTDELYVGYAGKLGADPTRGENSSAVRLEYQLSPRWSLEGVFGDVRREADLIWSNEY